ncbi:MAG: hypothetical protein ACTSRK_16705 [Promethearchaeota archaeon]
MINNEESTLQKPKFENKRKMGDHGRKLEKRRFLNYYMGIPQNKINFRQKVAADQGWVLTFDDVICLPGYTVRLISDKK